MNFDRAAQLYISLRQEKEAVEAEAKRRTAEIKAKMAELENWFTLKAEEAGLKNVPTMHGTAYWSTHYSATVAAREPFFEFVKENDAWDLVQARASSSAVKSFIDGHGEPPPGVNFSAVKVFNLREGKVENDAKE
jgi:hypothetical protein